MLKNNKMIIKVLFILLLFILLLFIFCLRPIISSALEATLASANHRQDNEKLPELFDKNLDMWMGEYEYYEFAQPDINYKVKMKILKEGDEYFADIYINGFQIWEELRANIVGNKDEIYFLYKDSRLNNPNVLHDEGELLLKFYFQDGYMLTDWLAIKPHIIENQVSGNVRFIRSE